MCSHCDQRPRTTGGYCAACNAAYRRAKRYLPTVMCRCCGQPNPNPKHLDATAQAFFDKLNPKP